jgi:hypothetical protein
MLIRVLGWIERVGRKNVLLKDSMVRGRCSYEGMQESVLAGSLDAENMFGADSSEAKRRAAERLKSVPIYNPRRGCGVRLFFIQMFLTLAQTQSTITRRARAR